MSSLMELYKTKEESIDYLTQGMNSGMRNIPFCAGTDYYAGGSEYLRPKRFCDILKTQV